MDSSDRRLAVLEKSPTGISGFDAITGGGIPRGRPTLVAGAAGCEKTLFSMEFLVRGATQFAEPGVFISFEETESDLRTNVASLGFDMGTLAEQKKIAVDYVRVEPGEIEETGEYDLAGLFVRLNYAIDAIGAKRVVLDTLETLFYGLSDKTVPARGAGSLLFGGQRVYRQTRERGTLQRGDQ